MKKGFNVGPQNLPDGSHQRKVDKIQRRLMENAKIRKSHDKFRAREEKGSKEDTRNDSGATETRHPERQAMIDTEAHDASEGIVTDYNEDSTKAAINRRYRRTQQQPFAKEQRQAEAKQKEHDRRRKEIAASQVEREKRLAERDRWRRTMANAKGRNGRSPKLGKESTVLLEKVRRMMAIENS